MRRLIFAIAAMAMCLPVHAQAQRVFRASSIDLEQNDRLDALEGKFDSLDRSIAKLTEVISEQRQPAVIASLPKIELITQTPKATAPVSKAPPAPKPFVPKTAAITTLASTATRGYGSSGSASYGSVGSANYAPAAIETTVSLAGYGSVGSSYYAPSPAPSTYSRTRSVSVQRNCANGSCANGSCSLGQRAGLFGLRRR